MKERLAFRLVRGVKHAVEVPVGLIEDGTSWSPYLTLEDAKELDAVRKALRRGDVTAASRLGARTVSQ